MPPCGDTISLVLTDSRSQVALAYVLHRAPDARPNTVHPNFREIFLDPTAGVYRRNVFNDLSTIPAFNPAAPQIDLIVFELSDHGFATLDNLCFAQGLSTPNTCNP